MGKRLPHNAGVVATSRARRRFMLAGLAVALPGGSPLARTVLSDLPMLLVAQPSLRDPMFGRGVVLVLRTPTDEVIGLILNRALDAPVPPPAGADMLTVWRGGPLAPAAWFALAANAPHVEGTLGAGDGIRFAAGSAGVERLLAAPGSNPRRVFRGYAGWAPGQLEGEIDAGAWITFAVDAGLVFDAEPLRLWERLVASRRAVHRRGTALPA